MLPVTLERHRRERVLRMDTRRPSRSLLQVTLPAFSSPQDRTAMPLGRTRWCWRADMKPTASHISSNEDRSSIHGISTQYLMCAATVNVSVQQEQNVTLSCHLNSSSEMAWYRLSSEKITLLISAARGNLQKKDFITYYNEDDGHFRLEADLGLDSISLAIAGVRESDLGLYYCALGVGAKTMRFGTAFRLTFTDAEQQHSSSIVGCRTLLVCAFVACGLCGILCMCVLCYRQGSSSVSCISCVKENSNVKAAQVQYSSLRFLRRSRAAPPAAANVTYATIAIDNHTP